MWVKLICLMEGNRDASSVGGGINLRPVLSVFDSFVAQPFFFCVKEDGA